MRTWCDVCLSESVVRRVPIPSQLLNSWVSKVVNEMEGFKSAWLCYSCDTIMNAERAEYYTFRRVGPLVEPLTLVVIEDILDADQLIY